MNGWGTASTHLPKDLSAMKLEGALLLIVERANKLFFFSSTDPIPGSAATFRRPPGQRVLRWLRAARPIWLATRYAGSVTPVMRLPMVSLEATSSDALCSLAEASDFTASQGPGRSVTHELLPISVAFNPTNSRLSPFRYD